MERTALGTAFTSNARGFNLADALPEQKPCRCKPCTVVIHAASYVEVIANWPGSSATFGRDEPAFRQEDPLIETTTTDR